MSYPDEMTRLATAYNCLAQCLVSTEVEADHEVWQAAQDRIFVALCKEIVNRDSYDYHPREIECMALGYCNSIR